MVFQNLTATWTQGAGVRTVVGGIRAKWAATGGLFGPAGAAVGPETVVAANGGGWSQEFTGGLVYHSKSLADGFLRKGSGLFNAWQAAGGVSGSWGWPLSDETCTADAQCQVVFQNLTATWTQGAGVTTRP